MSENNQTPNSATTPEESERPKDDLEQVIREAGDKAMERLIEEFKREQRGTD